MDDLKINIYVWFSTITWGRIYLSMETGDCFLHFYTLVHNRLKKIVFQVETFIIEYYLL